ncbi:MAG: 50S ribosomal protein L10 [Acidobacteria bacterium]|nr:50S ribosomal protein L10 [Acidobacteriota bacterium]
MKTREQKQQNLEALTEQFQAATAAMLVGFTKMSTAIALSENDPVALSKAISKFAKDNPEVFTFKAGVVEGRVVALSQVEAFASLPSKEVLISKIMFLINCQAQRLVTVLSAVPRNLAIVVKQIGEQKGGGEAA